MDRDDDYRLYEADGTAVVLCNAGTADLGDALIAAGRPAPVSTT
jgi:hypothetical protein